MAKQLSFQNTNWRHRYSHGGSLRQKRAGRGARPLSSKEPIHLVLKANKEVIRGGFRVHRRFALIHHLLQKYQAKFFIKIEQVSIQGDHIHLLIRTTRRSLYQNFFRVVAGQIAQRFEKEGLLTVAVAKTAHVTGTPASIGLESGLWRQEGVVGDEGVGIGEGVKAEGRFGITDTVRTDAVLRANEAVRTEETVMLDRLKVSGLWKHRPFTRVVKGYRAFQTVRDYIQLNEREALGRIPYRSQRLKGLSSSEWEVLWS